MHILMGKYKDRPMDLADASLVAAAEARQVNRIFTLDSDFRFYRLNDKDSFEVIP
jgi:predicted nucleic acid-binding protein